MKREIVTNQALERRNGWDRPFAMAGILKLMGVRKCEFYKSEKIEVRVESGKRRSLAEARA